MLKRISFRTKLVSSDKANFSTLELPRESHVSIPLPESNDICN